MVINLGIEQVASVAKSQCTARVRRTVFVHEVGAPSREPEPMYSRKPSIGEDFSDWHSFCC